MRIDTPLAEVVAILPKESARLLDTVDNINISRVVLENVRSAVLRWEQVGIVLDPVQFETVLDTFVEAQVELCVLAVRLITRTKQEGS